MGPRETKLLATAAAHGEAATVYPEHVLREARLADALEEAIDGWERLADGTGSNGALDADDRTRERLRGVLKAG